MRMNRKILGLLSLGHGITDIIQGGLTMTLAFLQPILGLSQLQIGMVMLSFNLSSSVIQPAFGVLSDRFHVAWLIPVGCLLGGIGMSFVGFMPNVQLLMLAALISGLGVAAYHPEGSKYARSASGERKASGMSLFSVGGNFGFAAGPLLASMFIAVAGRGGPVGFLLINGTMSLVLWYYLPSITRQQSKAEKAEQLQAVQARAGGAGGGLTRWQIAYPMVVLVLLIIMRTWVHAGVVTFLPQYYMHHLGYTQGYTALLTSIFLFAGGFGTIAGGPAADRWGLKPIIVASLASVALLLYLFPRVAGWASLVVMGLAGFALISTFAITVVMGQELLPHRVGLASGMTLGFGIGAGGIGATFIGGVADRWGLPSIFDFMIGFTIAGLLLAFLLPGRKRLAERKEVLEGVAVFPDSV